jgi:hypothetical protein
VPWRRLSVVRGLIAAFVVVLGVMIGGFLIWGCSDTTGGSSGTYPSPTPSIGKVTFGDRLDDIRRRRDERLRVPLPK